MTDFLDIPIEELELGVRAYNILKRHGVHTFGDLQNVTANDANEWASDSTAFGSHILGLPAAREVIFAQNYIREALEATK